MLYALLGQSALLDACNEFDTYTVIAKRENFTNTAKAKMVDAYKKLDCEVSGLQVDSYLLCTDSIPCLILLSSYFCFLFDTDWQTGHVVLEYFNV